MKQKLYSMIFNLKNEIERQNYKEQCNKLYEKKCVVELIEKKPMRTIPQNSYLHLLLGWFACEYGCSLEEAKVDFFKRECNKVIFERTRNNKHDIEIKYLRSSRDLDTSEMTTAIERFRNWSSAIAGIYLPSPNENDMLLQIKQEIERNKEFL